MNINTNKTNKQKKMNKQEPLAVLNKIIEQKRKKNTNAD